MLGNGVSSCGEAAIKRWVPRSTRCGGRGGAWPVGHLVAYNQVGWRGEGTEGGVEAVYCIAAESSSYEAKPLIIGDRWGGWQNSI